MRFQAPYWLSGALHRRTEGFINLSLYILGLVDQFHHFTDQDVSFLVHQLKSLTGKSQRIFGKYQITLGGKVFGSINSHLPLAYSLFIVLVQDFCIDSVEFSFGRSPRSSQPLSRVSVILLFSVSPCPTNSASNALPKTR